MSMLKGIRKLPKTVTNFRVHHIAGQPLVDLESIQQPVICENTNKKVMSHVNCFNHWGKTTGSDGVANYPDGFLHLLLHGTSEDTITTVMVKFINTVTMLSDHTRL